MEATVEAVAVGLTHRGGLPRAEGQAGGARLRNTGSTKWYVPGLLLGRLLAAESSPGRHLHDTPRVLAWRQLP